ncbi:DUF6325 family protein [Actinoplanes sp. KI2]|uniref:DUF6325 family protein n=1 Tax=Actinoplanes sp. KI2 TaxID=2983315 RepID=UPI0021D5A24C|nr:DUF6325 family protein [Actinoplanes sp. KI2]MCU7726868.1 DUF6325 family protein [Actinoplanes sp. KI2]
MTGPVQVLVVGFDQLVQTGEVMAELERLRRAGTVRLLDVLVVKRTEDGAFHTLPAPAGAPPDMGTRVAAILGAPPDEDGSAAAPGGGPTWSLADAIPEGTTAAVALLEHLWATPLREAIHRAGGKALDETWLAQPDVERLEHLITP